MKKHELSSALVLALSLIIISEAYHNHFENYNFHCWKLNGANKDNAFQCKKVNFIWLETPPDVIEQDAPFIVKYELLPEDGFMQWMIDEKYFPDELVNGNVTRANEFCYHERCNDASNAGVDNCCVHHINIHSCPMESVEAAGDVCGPWIPDGGVYTHTQSEASHIRPWNTSVVLTQIGVNTIIAHLRVGEVQFALGHKITVFPKANCSDGYCDTRTENCDTCPADCCPGLKLEILIVIIVISSLLVLCMILVPAVWYYQKQRFLYDESWVIENDNIKTSSGYKGFGSVKSIASTCMSQISMGGTNGGVGGAAQQPVRGQIFCETGILDGKLICVKKIHKTSFNLSRQTRIEVSHVRALDHINVSRFVGIVAELDNFAIITEYCPKGSLSDVLLNDEVPLNWGFRLSFAQDICRGVCYLHSHKVYHGRLKSSNCVIDDRWVCKITDHGLPNIRIPDVDPENGELFSSMRERRINRVYRPPEALADPTLIHQPSTDVYSFAIILVEIGDRTEISPPEETIFDPLWRPELPELNEQDNDQDNKCPEASKYVDLIVNCWQDRPSSRPTFEGIKKNLHLINPYKENPVDMMMKLMEKYSKHLEMVVCERTFDLIEEKKKTDRLLYAMLPASVAEDLKQGKAISATKYDACTIFFSDIVGFTNLSSSSTPMEVVELLNQMYTAFDSIIDEHDVYKVETIGDAYMVVSGVPNKNGDKHAEEIAMMAIKIVMFCRGFRVPHRADQIVNIRAGVHSGPVVTGVVGLKMPRFCLFGDTVNMASRMESTGEALKIQVSPTTHNLLKDKEEFRFEYRGEVEVKGKGTQRTHWLLGKSELSISNCLSPASHKRIFKGALPKPKPLTPTPAMLALETPDTSEAAPSAPPASIPTIPPPPYAPVSPSRERSSGSTSSRDKLLV